MKAIAGWLFSVWVGIRCVPSMIRHSRGRWHVFRDEPDWLVELLADAGAGATRRQPQRFIARLLRAGGTRTGVAGTSTRMALTVGGLFSGIGGFELGLERAGMVVRWHCEIDPYANAVLAKHWPHVPNGDIRRLQTRAVEPVDVICGGFPCQDISLAGSLAGIDGERSGLWADFARVVGELRPRYVVIVEAERAA